MEYHNVFTIDSLNITAVIVYQAGTFFETAFDNVFVQFDKNRITMRLIWSKNGALMIPNPAAMTILRTSHKPLSIWNYR